MLISINITTRNEIHPYNHLLLNDMKGFFLITNISETLIINKRNNIDLNDEYVATVVNIGIRAWTD